MLTECRFIIRDDNKMIVYLTPNACALCGTVALSEGSKGDKDDKCRDLKAMGT